MTTPAGKTRRSIENLKARVFSGPAGRIFRGMATIAAGSILGRIISILVIPLLSRLYDPESFGVLAIFTATVTFLMPLATLQYQLAIPLPRANSVAMNVTALSALSMLVITLLLAVLLWLLGTALFPLLNLAALAPYRWLIVIGLLAVTSYNVMSMWATRRQDYAIMSRTSVIQSAAGAATKLLLGLIAATPAGLLIGQIISQGGGTVTLCRQFRADLRRNLPRVSLRRLVLVSRRYRHFPLYRLPSQYVLVFSQQAPIMFVGAFYGMEVAGQLAIATMLVTLPVNLLSWSLTKAAYGEIARIKNENPAQLKNIMKSIVGKLFLLSATVSLLLYLLAPPVLPAILGSQWQDAGLFASYLSLYVVATIIAIPMTAFINVFDRQKEFLLWNVLKAATLATLFGWTYYAALSPFVFIVLYGLAILLVESALIVRVGRIVELEVGQLETSASPPLRT